MTITILQAVRVGGTILAADTEHTLDAPMEADLVRRKLAAYVIEPYIPLSAAERTHHIAEHAELMPQDVAYDAEDRVIGYTLNGISYEVAYTAAGKVETITGGGRVVTYTYDENDRYTGGAIE